MKKLLKRIGIVLGGLVGLLLVAGFVLYLMGSSKAGATYDVTPSISSVTPDSASVARGEHLSQIHVCQYCHGDQLEGQVFVDIPPFLAVASNLTSGQGGVGQTYTDTDWDRSIRHGVKPDGKAVFIMPSMVFHNMSDADASALIAYIKSVPPVDNELPATEFRFPLLALAGAGQVDLAESVVLTSDHPAAPMPGPTATYGAYLARITCIGCHGDDLHGGVSPNPDIPGPDLMAAGVWPFDAFAHAMRTGERPSGATMDPELMPWKAFQHMTNEELQAIHEHLKTLAN